MKACGNVAFTQNLRDANIHKTFNKKQLLTSEKIMFSEHFREHFFKLNHLRKKWFSTGKKKWLTLQSSLVRGFHTLPLKINTFFQTLGCQEPWRGSGFPVYAWLMLRTALMTKHKHLSYTTAVRLEKPMRQNYRSEREAACIPNKYIKICETKTTNFCQYPNSLIPNYIGFAGSIFDNRCLNCSYKGL